MGSHRIYATLFCFPPHNYMKQVYKIALTSHSERRSLVFRSDVPLEVALPCCLVATLLTLEQFPTCMDLHMLG